MTRPNHPVTRALLGLGPGVVLLAAWQGLVFAEPSYEFFMGSPVGIVRAGTTLLVRGRLVSDMFITASEAFLGFLFGSTVGTAIGLSMWVSRNAYFLARPYLVGLGAVPVFALGPVLVFWLGTGMWSKVALGFLSTLVVAIVQAHSGALSADDNLLRLTAAFGGTRRQQFVTIIIPSAAIWVLAGVRLNIGMALLGAFVGEFLGSRAGLGHLIIVAEGLYDVNEIWVGIFGIILIATVFHSCTLPVERWANRWR